jgi:hypothetical protein
MKSIKLKLKQFWQFLAWLEEKRLESMQKSGWGKF